MSAGETAAILRTAAALVTPVGRWVQGDYARDLDDDALDRGWDGWNWEVEDEDPSEPVCFCPLGAIAEAADCSTDSLGEEPAAIALRDHLRLGSVSEIADWNDLRIRTQEEVVEALLLTAHDLDPAGARA